MEVSYEGPATLRLLFDVCIQIMEQDFVLWGYHISMLNIMIADAALAGLGWLTWRIIQRDD